MKKISVETVPPGLLYLCDGCNEPNAVECIDIGEEEFILCPSCFFTLFEKCKKIIEEQTKTSVKILKEIIEEGNTMTYGICLRCGELSGKCACENWEDHDPNLYCNKIKTECKDCQWLQQLKWEGNDPSCCRQFDNNCGCYNYINSSY